MEPLRRARQRDVEVRAAALGGEDPARLDDQDGVELQALGGASASTPTSRPSGAITASVPCYQLGPQVGLERRGDGPVALVQPPLPYPRRGLPGQQAGRLLDEDGSRARQPPPAAVRMRA
jgi:hypothetical protein